MAYGFIVNCEGNAVAQLRKIDEALKAAGVNTKVQIGEIENQFTGMGEKVKSVMADIKGLLLGGILAGGIFGGFEFIKDSTKTFDDLQKSITKVDTVLKSTNFAAGFSSDAIKDQAEGMNKQITNSMAQIMDAEGMQLSFKNIKGNVFKGAMGDVADFATFYKEDMTSAALQVDKAVNDPLKGFHRLERMGVTFTEEQEKQIKNYAKQNDLADEQRVILKELHSEFGGQAAAFAQTDQGKRMMDEKGWETLKVQIGEVISKVQLSLLPLFADIRDLVKQAFESGPVQFFINHIKDLLAIGLKIIPMWLVYKGIMGANALITSIFSVENGVLTASMGSLTLMTDGATVAAEGFAAAFSSTGIGAIAVALGFVVEKLISMNTELDKSIDKKFKLSESNDFYKNQAEKYKSIKERVGELNDPNFGTKEKQELYSDIQSYLQSTRLKFPALQGTAHELHKNKVDYESHRTWMNKLNDATSFGSSTHDKIREDYGQQAKSLSQLASTIPDVKDALTTLAKQGIKAPKGYADAGGVSGIKGNAYSTAELAGAKGGLGEAKIINIHIDTVQKIDGILPEGIKNNAQSAIEILIRTINNMAYSQSGTM